MSRRRIGITLFGLVAVCIGAAAFYVHWFSFRLNELGTTWGVTEIAIGASPKSMVSGSNGKKLFVMHSPPSGHGSLTIVSMENNAVVRTIDLGDGFPKSLSLKPDGTQVFVTISKAAASTVSSGANRVAVIDVEDQQITATVLVTGGSPFGVSGIAFLPDGRRAYVTDRFSNKVHVIDTAKQAVTSSIDVAGGPFGIATTPDGSRAYIAACRGSRSTVFVLDTATESVVTGIPVRLKRGPADSFVTISPDGKSTYVTFAKDSKISVIDSDPRSRTYNQEVTVIATPGDDLRDLTLSEDGTLAVVASRLTDAVVVLNTDRNSPTFHSVVKTFQVGDSPWDVVIKRKDARRSVVYVTNSRDGTLTVFGQ